MSDKNRGKIEGEEAGATEEKSLNSGKKETAVSGVKPEIKGEEEGLISKEYPGIKGEKASGTNQEEPVIKGEMKTVTDHVNPVTKPGNADAVIVFRLRKNLKKDLQEEAKGRGITLTELILSRVKGSKVRDRKNEEKIISVIEDFTREFNQIGNNINQIAVAIHQIKNEHRIETGQFAEITNTIEAYNERIDFLRSSLLKIESDDI
ncbi:MAG: plasmid mobilization relaxosome protein MobC [Ginsengibacter sp.]